MKRQLLLSIAVLSTLAFSAQANAEDAQTAVEAAPAAAPAEPASPHTIAYNVGLYSQYVFRGLTQTGENLALQGGVDYSHVSGFYAGAWASNISWLEDAGTGGVSAYKNSSIELDLYGGYRNTIGDTGIGYDIGLLQYIYPGDNNNNWINDAETTEIYGALSWKWLQAKYSHIVSSDAWGTPNGRNTYYAELNANIPVADTGITANLHVGRQDFSGDVAGVSNDQYSYTDWKIGATKSFSNGINIGGYYTDTNANKVSWTDQSNQYLGDNQFTVFVQKTF